MHLNSRLPVATAVLVVAAVGCAMMEPTAERYVAPPVGTTWKSAQHDTGSYGSGSAQDSARRGERTWQGQSVITFEGRNGTIVATPGGNWLGIFAGDKAILSWDPPLSWPWPLEVGKSWTHQHRLTFHAAGRTVSFSLAQKVESYEDATVPAGTFKTFKVSSVSSLGEENVFWFSPELGIFVKQSLKRTAQHPQGPGTREIELLDYKRGG